MAKNKIRLQYSGFVIFAAKMLSIATGLVFQLMIARATTKPEYGIWFNISDVSAYFTLLAGAFPFWTMRFVARGKEGAIKTGFLINLTISVIATVIYIPLVPLITSSLGISEKYLILYFLVSMRIVELYSLGMLEACLRAKTPQVLGYGLLIEEGCKVVLGYILIIKFQQPLLGAMLSLIVAYAFQVVYYLKLTAKELRQPLRWSYVREWLKGSVANLYNIVGGQISAFVFIMLLAYGGEAARGNYGAAAQIASIITYSSFLSFALYPKLLAEKSMEDVTTSLKMVLMFAIPMTAGAVAIPESYLAILKIVYREAAPVLMVLAADALIITISQFLSSVLFGVEKIDEKAKIPLREIAKTRLFIVFTLPYINSAITLPTAFYVLTTFARNQSLQAAIYVSVINMAAHLIMLFVLYAVVRNVATINIPWRNMAKYVFASAVMAATLYIIPHQTRLILTLGVTAVGAIIYLTLLLTIDKEARDLTGSILQELKIMLGRQ